MLRVNLVDVVKCTVIVSKMVEQFIRGLDIILIMYKKIFTVLNY